MGRGVYRQAPRGEFQPPALLAALAPLPVLLLVSLLAACSGQQTPRGVSDPDPGSPVGEVSEAAEGSETRSEALKRQLDALLAENLTESDYQESFNCLYRNNFRHVSALGDSYLIFSKGDSYWINRLKSRCMLLNHRMMFTFVSHTQSVCAGDSVYLSDRADLDRGFDASGRPAVMLGSCVLGEFESINEAQAMALKEAVKGSSAKGKSGNNGKQGGGK